MHLSTFTYILASKVTIFYFPQFRRCSIQNVVLFSKEIFTGQVWGCFEKKRKILRKEKLNERSVAKINKVKDFARATDDVGYSVTGFAQCVNETLFRGKDIHGCLVQSSVYLYEMPGHQRQPLLFWLKRCSGTRCWAPVLNKNGGL